MNLLRSAAPFIGALVAGVFLAVLAVLLNVASPSLGFVAGFCAAIVALLINSALHAAVPISPAGNTLDVASSGSDSGSDRPPPRPRQTTAQAHPPAAARAPVDRSAAVSSARPASTNLPDIAATTEAPQAAGPRASGNVKWFNRTKGYGFIQCDDGQEVFVHHRNLRGVERQALRDGERVSFAIVERNRGPQAEDVTVVA